MELHEFHESLPNKKQSRPFDEIRLTIGQAVHLQSGTPPVRYSVKLIGYMLGGSIIVSTPIQDEKVLLVHEEQSFVVHMFSGRCRYSFSAQVIMVGNAPCPYLYLSYPEKVSEMEIRKGVRAHVDLKAIVTDESARIHAVNINDLSLGGCAIVSDLPLGRIGHKVQISLPLSINRASALLDIHGEIRSAREVVEAGRKKPRLQYGVQFENISKAEGVMITAYVYQAVFDGAPNF